MAMLANPKIMFFDEPSSGVDPISRRFLWKSLYMSARTRNASMVLTTHTMSEAESLCSRIGILIMGKFITVGTPNSLKLKYGKGYRIFIELKEKNGQEIVQAVKNSLGNVVKVEELSSNN
jgi:ATP-binding cassette subfamily A (ABC1) protein 3